MVIEKIKIEACICNDCNKTFIPKSGYDINNKLVVAPVKCTECGSIYWDVDRNKKEDIDLKNKYLKENVHTNIRLKYK